MAVIKVDVKGETCPVPLVETRKAIMKAKKGDVIEVTGTHPASKKEIPMAVESLGLKVIEISGGESEWVIKIQV